LLFTNLKTKVQKTVILCVFLYGYATWSVTVKEGLRLRVFKNRVLRRTLAPKKEEIIGDWRRLHNEELNNFYPSPIILRTIKSRRRRCSIWGM
jgi:hypothetical protein